MFENTKCECGHQNPAATVLCEACGKPQTEGEEDIQLEMRYDGILRRSQRANPGIVDRIWRFFSSVKVAVRLIAATLLLATLGTVLPQENTFLNQDPAVYYQENYGTLGRLYYLTGLSHTYESWWFITLIMMIGASLVICSLDRVLPLYRSLSRQQVRKAQEFIRRQRLTYSGPLPDKANWVEEASAAFKRKGYRVHLDKDGQALMAEKHRFSRWGPYVNHIGLIIFLGAVLARNIPGWHMDQYLAFPEGEPVKIPGTPYYLMNERFSVEFYETDPLVPRLYETQAILYTCSADCDDPDEPPVLEQVHAQSIEVNKPLRYQELLAYQFDYKEAPMLLSVTAALRDKTSGGIHGSFQLDMLRPQPGYSAGAYNLELKSYFPEFSLNKEGQPVTLSKDPLAPAFLFLIKGPALPEDGALYMFFPRAEDQLRFRQEELNGELGQRLELTADIENVRVSLYTSYLNIRKEKALPFIWSGSAVFMIGLVMGFYWQHRRVWLRIDGDMLLLGAHTNKNWFGLRKECAFILERTGIKVEPKSLERGGGQI
ncbi:MAG: cytochrome biosis protein ResB [Paenibacillaceae bacterium]|jgi:cytochrome c biogenesis protein|nr:cytochrome biosis protein ResB [Paenibacillaceae bacterium]